jgi:16S rRNA (guanine(966)-N(2))-methyltransferase RsmD
MRIIGGEWGGRKFKPPPEMPYTRPTTDLAKEGLFNIIQHQLSIEDLKTLDLFGGTGSITYELASRGARDLTIVEKDAAMYDFIRKTADTLKIQNLKLIRSDVFKFLQNCKETYDLIFAGPPYALKNIDDLPMLVEEKQLLNPGGWFVLEHTPRNNYEGWPMFAAMRNYGTTVFSFFVRRPGETSQ